MKYSINPYLFFFIVTFVFLFPLNAQPQAAEETLPIEGIVYESKDPAQSFMVIDGNIYKKGEQYQSYEILEVRQDRIIVKDATGKVSQQRIKGGNRPAAPQAVEKPVAALPPQLLQHQDQSTALNLAEPTNPNATPNMLEQFKKMLGNFDIAAIMNYVSEIAVMADLRNLYSQANIAAMEDGGERNLNLDQLIKEERINPAYKESKNGYRFRIDLSRQGAQVYADPVKAQEKSRHYMIDSWGNMRGEEGRPATEKSPFLQPPSWLKGLMPQASSQQQGIPNDAEPSSEEENSAR